MEAYTEFAAVYDEFMDNVPYDEWADYLHGLLQKMESKTDWCWILDAEPVR